METLDHPEVAKALAWIRFLVFNEADTKVSVDLGKVLKAEFTCVSQANELKMWEKIKVACTTILEKYPNSIEVDEELLATPEKFSFTQLNCIQLRHNEKKIMLYMQKTADIFLRLLKLTRKEAN